MYNMLTCFTIAVFAMLYKSVIVYVYFTIIVVVLIHCCKYATQQTNLYQTHFAIEWIKQTVSIIYSNLKYLHATSRKQKATGWDWCRNNKQTLLPAGEK